MLQTFNPASAGSYRQQKDRWAIIFLLLHVYWLADGHGCQSNAVFLEFAKSIHLRWELDHCHDLLIGSVLNKYRQQI